MRRCRDTEKKKKLDSADVERLTMQPCFKRVYWFRVTLHHHCRAFRVFYTMLVKRRSADGKRVLNIRLWCVSAEKARTFSCDIYCHALKDDASTFKVQMLERIGLRKELKENRSGNSAVSNVSTDDCRRIYPRGACFASIFISVLMLREPSNQMWIIRDQRRTSWYTLTIKYAPYKRNMWKRELHFNLDETARHGNNTKVNKIEGVI